MNTDRPYTLNRLVHILGMLVVLATLVWLLYYLSAVLVPFFIALLLAYIMDPGVTRVQKFVKNRAVAVMLTLVVVIAIVTGFFMITGPMVAREVQHFARLMAEQLPGWIAMAQDTPWIHDLLMQASTFDVEQYLTGENLMNVARKALPGFWQGLSSVFGWLLGLIGVFTTIIYLVFILIDEEDLKANWHTWIPPKYRDRVSAVVEDVERSMNLYFRGQLKIALILSVIYILGFSIVGLPMALVLGLLAGMLSLIPYFALLSVLPVMLSAGLLALDQGGSFWPPMIGALVVYAVAQGLEGLVLTPRIQGKNTGLRPEYILLALSVWGSLLGVVGMIIALPLTAVLISYYRRSVLGEVEAPLVVPSQVDPTSGTKPADPLL
ncbi:MAG: AI-2E family transporter [Flavobacteriales bacterium]|nr:AI-2E family transporter [Flavobacteriales bacterium]